MNEFIPYLTNLLKNENYIYNKTQFQQDESKVETCGDHVCCFLYCFRNYGMNLENYKEYMQYLKRILKQPYDYIAAEFVAEQLKL